MKVAVPRESFPGERRVAIVPAVIPSLAKAGCEVLVETGAGVSAGYADAAYTAKGGKIASRQEVFAADVLLQVRAGGATAQSADSSAYRSGQTVVAMADPLNHPRGVADVAGRGVTLFALELLPRITRAQSMDVLSSMATVAGYKAVLLAANIMPKMMPMLMTAAGTITAAKVFIIGAGVAGLQAIATAKRLGAVISAYDTRPAGKQDAQSLGAKVVDVPLDTTSAEGKGGYAQEMGEEFYRRQREFMGKVAAESDIVISTAAIPGKRSPLLITAEAVAKMAPGSVIVDLAAERGGNCELTKADQTVDHNGVIILGPTNLPSTAPYHASQMYAKNVATFLLHLVKNGQMTLDLEDEITRETLVARDGQVVSPRVQQALAE